MNSILKKIYQLAITAAEKYQNEETGYLHLYCDHTLKISDSTIPIYHNFLFALALLRSKEKERMQRAKELLSSLLYFQNEEGNFPIYLHQFPTCHRKYQILDNLIPIYWILLDFKNILGSELSLRLEKMLSKAFSFIESIEEEENSHIVIKIQRAVVQYAFAQLNNNIEEQAKAGSSLNDLSEKISIDIYGSPRLLAKVLICLEMLPDQIKQELFKTFYQYLELSWHQKMHRYIGLSYKEYKTGEDYEMTLLDLYMGLQNDQLTDRLLKPMPYHLEGVLLSSTEKILRQHIEKDSNWNIIKEQDYSFSYFNIPISQWLKNRASFPFKLTFLDKNQKVRSLVIPMKSYFQIEHLDNKTILFKIQREIDEPLDFSLYFDRTKASKVLIQQKPATTFSASDKVVIDYQSFSLSISIENALDNQLIGQVMFEDRQSQLDADPGNIKDWHLYLREISKEKKVIELKLKITG